MLNKKNTVNEVDKTNLSKFDLDRVIEMAWEDRTTFKSILYQFNVSEKRGDINNEKRIKIKEF